jgi:transposase
MSKSMRKAHPVPAVAPVVTIGLDVGDRYTTACVVDAAGEVSETARVRTTPAALEQRLRGLPRCRVVLETGTHSAWLSRVAEACGHEVVVANARRLRLISENASKSDDVDAETLARVGRLDPTLLAPVQLRTADTQAALAVLRARDALVRTRTLLINHVRGAVKTLGARLPACSAPSFARRVGLALPAPLAPALTPLLEQVQQLTRQIADYDRAIEQLAARQYPVTAQLRHVRGVGPLTALCYVLVVEDPARFPSSRAVGAYVGLRPRRAQSGTVDPQLHITKTGDALLRRLLVNSAQYLLGPFGGDCDLRRWGLALAARGGKAAKNRAVVAVARKLAVLLHHLWTSGVRYDPLYQATRRAAPAA